MKYCGKCEQTIPKECFAKRGNGLQSNCKECNKKYLRLHYKRNKEYYLNKMIKARKSYRSWYDSVKSNYCCVECGESDIRCIDFHHINTDNKIDSVSTMMSQGLSKEKILREIEKCIPMCAIWKLG